MGELLAKGLMRMAIMQTGDKESLVEVDREIKDCVRDIVEKGRKISANTGCVSEIE